MQSGTGSASEDPPAMNEELPTPISDQDRAEHEIARLAADSERQRRLYETVLANTPDLVYVFDLNYRFVYANDALLKMWGRTHEEAVGKSLLEIGYEPWHAEMHEREIDQVRATRQPIRGVVPFTGTHGRREYDYIFAPIFGADGEVEAVAGTTRDVTELKEAENLLRRNNDTFFELIQNNPFGVYVIDADFCLRQVSLGAQKVFENVRPLLGRDFADVLHTLWPEPFASEALGRFRHTLETGEPYFSASTVEKRADIAQVEAYDWRIERFNMPDGRYGVVCYFYDLSERQQWEMILRRSEERLRLATEAAELGIWTWQPDKDVVAWENDRPYAIFALPRSEPPVTAARFTEEFLHPEDLETFETAFTRAVEEKAPLLLECRIRRTDGVVRWVEFTGRMVDGEDSPSLIGTVQDITDRKEAEESILLSEAKQRFTVRLTDALRPLSDPIQVQAEASRLLGQQLGANRVAYFELNGDDYQVERNYTNAVPSVVGTYPAAAFGADLLATYRAGCTAVEEDVASMPSLLPDQKEAFAALQIRSYIGVPLVKDGVFVAGLTVHATNPRKWTLAEVAMAEDTAERTWAAIERIKAEAALRASEESRRLALDGAELGTFNIDLSTFTMITDERFRTIFGGATETMTYEEAFAIIHADDRDRIGKAVAAATRTDDPAPYAEEYRVVHPDGSVRWVFAKGRATFAGQGPKRIVSFDGTILDITARKEAEESIRLSEAKQRFTVRLTDALRPLSDPIEVQAEASRLLGEHLSANRVVYFEILGDEYVIERDYSRGVRSLVGRYPVSSFGPALLNQLLNGRTVVEADATVEPARSPDEQAAFASIQVRGHVDVPLVKEGQFIAGMTVHISDRRDWTEHEVALIEETAERTWAAVERVRAEAALRQSEERSAFVRHSSGVGTWYCDLPFDVLEWDDLVKAHFHLPPDSIVTIETFYERIHPDDREPTRLAIEESISSRTPYNIDYRTVNPETGAEKWIRAIGRTFYASDGAPIQFDGVTLDISDQKLREQKNMELLRELEEQHEFVKAVISQIPSAIVVADAATGQIRITNDEAHRIVKHEYEKGKRLEDYGNSYIRQGYATDGSLYSKGRWPLDRAQLGETIVGEEIENVMFDGSRVIVRVNAGPIRVGGKVVAAVAAFHDITERKAAERAARFLADASAALSEFVNYEQTLERVANLAVPIFADWAVVDMADESGAGQRLVVAHVDPAKADLAKALHDRFTLADAVGPGTIFRAGRSQLRSFITDEMLVGVARDELELANLRELGPESYIGVPLIVRGKPLGVITFVLAGSGRHYNERDLEVANDLAARASIAIENAQLYERLKESDRRKDEFLATLAHELRNPLAPIRSGLEFIRMVNYVPDAVEKTSTIMERQLRHMVRLVDDLMDVSRINSGKLVLQKELITLESVVDSALESSRPLIEQMGHALSVDLPEEAVIVDADLTRLAQVFSNLLNNAAKYTERGGQIWLTAELQGSDVVVSVKDNGVGIAADQLPRVFEMFSQVKSSLDKAQGGLGIGLMLVQQLVDMHGGSIEAHSEGPGKGAEFVVYLPAVVEDSKNLEGEEADGTDSADSRRILIVDDNQDIAYTLAKLLEINGNKTLAAYSGEEAVASAAEFKPDVILLDIGLPGMSGYEACRLIRQQADGREITIIAQSGWGSTDDRRQSDEAGFDYHLVKPVDMQALLKLLKDSGKRTALGRDFAEQGSHEPIES